MGTIGGRRRTGATRGWSRPIGGISCRRILAIGLSTRCKIFFFCSFEPRNVRSFINLVWFWGENRVLIVILGACSCGRQFAWDWIEFEKLKGLLFFYFFIFLFLKFFLGLAYWNLLFRSGCEKFLINMVVKWKFDDLISTLYFGYRDRVFGVSCWSLYFCDRLCKIILMLRRWKNYTFFLLFATWNLLF